MTTKNSKVSRKENYFTCTNNSTKSYDAFQKKLIKLISTFQSSNINLDYVLASIHIENLDILEYVHKSSLNSIFLTELQEIVRSVVGEDYLLLPISHDRLILVFNSKKQCDNSKIIHNIANSFSNLSFQPKTSKCNAHPIIKIGYVTASKSQSNLNEIIHQSRLALYDCRYSKVSCTQAFYLLDRSINNSVKYTKLANILQKAIIDKRIKLAFQAIINSNTGNIEAYECLLRIITNEGKMISANNHLQAAEKLGLINKIDLTVLKIAVKELITNPELQLSINLSSLSINDYEWLTTARKLLKSSSLSQRLIIEITETSFSDDSEQLNHFINLIRSIGCKVALDDFGAGYTCFSQLYKLKVDFIKIDGNLIKNIFSNKGYQLLVKSVIKIAQERGIKVIAEFVENKKIANKITDFGADYLQGSYFSNISNKKIKYTRLNNYKK